jgi:replication-associated recombination protein RarA
MAHFNLAQSTRPIIDKNMRTEEIARVLQDEWVGNRPILEYAIRAFSDKRGFPSGVILASDRALAGVGKTTLAYIIKSLMEIALEGKPLLFREVDGGELASVDEMRALLIMLRQQGFTNVGYKVLVINEIQNLSKASFTAMLTFLEEQAKHGCTVIGTTTEVDKVFQNEKIPARRRYETFTFKPVPVAELITHLKKVVAKYNLVVSDKILKLIADTSKGSPGVCLQLLSTIQHTDTDEAALKLLSLPSEADEDNISKAFASILYGIESQKGAAYSSILKARESGVDIGSLRYQLTHMALNALAKKGADVKAAARLTKMLKTLSTNTNGAPLFDDALVMAALTEAMYS